MTTATRSRRQSVVQEARELLGDAAGASAHEYAVVGDNVRSAGDGMDAGLRRTMLAEVLRRRRSTDSVDVGASLDDLAAILQTSLVEDRAAAKRAVVAQSERTQPLRRRVLDVLSLGPLSPSELAEQMQARPETVSRLVRALEAEGLLVRSDHSDDRRRKLYALTAPADALLADQLSFGEPPPPPEITAEQATAAIERGLREAICLRRRDNSLDEAVARIETAIRESRTYGLSALELRGRRELATTLRQAERRSALRAQLSEFKRIAKGLDPRFGAELAVPAMAHLQYERGRLTETLGARRTAVRTAALVNAAGLYASLAEAGVPGDDWMARRAWALFSVADNCRQQTDLGRALGLANEAAELFAAADDDYGFANCLFLVGFCLRLRGDFAEGHVALAEALELAQADGHDRLQAMVLMQLGETRRCEGDFSAAHELLLEAQQRASDLGASVTEAFALSALGATTFGAGDPRQALKQLSEADAMLSSAGHREGLALNLRRLAVVQRTIMVQDRQTDAAEVRQLITRARLRYERLESPAGVTACLIESGRLTLGRGRTPRDVCQHLIAWVTPWTRRRLLQLDPWVPPMLVDFARDADDPALLATAQALEDEARQRSAERNAKRWSFLHERIAGRLAQTTRRRVVDRGSPDEMAGEPRRLSALEPVAI